MDNGSGKVRLLVWDERDVQKNLAEVIGREPELADNPVMESVFLWLMDRCSETESPAATVFKSVLSGTEEITAPKVIELRQSGFSVFVRGAANRDDGADFTSDIITQIDRSAGDGRLAEVIVASHIDTFESRLESLASQGIKTAVLGFRERAGFAAANPKIDFIDLESITELFRNELPRTNLYDIPEDGRALAPLGFPTRRNRRGGSTDSAPAVTTPSTKSASSAPTAPSTPAPTPSTTTASAPTIGSSASSSAPTAAKPAAPSAPKPTTPAVSGTPAAPPPPPAPAVPRESVTAQTGSTPTAPPPPAPLRNAPPPPAAPQPAKDASPIAAAPVVAAVGVTGAAAAAAAARPTVAEQPTREAVFDHVSDLVAAHGSGEGLRAGELDAELDRKFPGFDESAIGFGDRDELAEAVANDRNFVIDRDDLDRPILQLRSESASSGSSALDDLLSGIKPPRRRSRT